MIGIAARSGIALGLNLRRTSNKFDSESSESRKRLWWSIFHLEHLLSVMTGRVSCLGDGSCSAPPPLPTGISEYGVPGVSQFGNEPLAQDCGIQWTIYQRHEQIGAQQACLKSVPSSPSLYFFYLVDLSLIMHAITNRVYSTDVFQDGWAQIKSRIGLYSEKMDQWLSGLHASLAFEDIHGNTFPRSNSCYQVSLALHYYSARIVLNRPCLTRPQIDSKSGIRFPHSQFHNNTALACLRASLALINILPDQTETGWVYNTTSWWSFLHFLMQATIIMLIHMSVGSVPMRAGKGANVETGEGAVGISESPEIVLAATKKALHWLHCLGGSDEAARRAFHICNNYLHRIAPSKGLDLSGIPSNIGLSQTFGTADYPPGETSSSTPQQQNQSNSAPQHAQSTAFRGFDYNERDDMLFQEPEETHTSLDSIQSSSAVLDTDIDMSETISYPTNATLDDILFLLESNI